MRDVAHTNRGIVVRLSDDSKGRMFLKCTMCGTTWSPELTPSGYLPANYCNCPKGCDTAEIGHRDYRPT